MTTLSSFVVAAAAVVLPIAVAFSVWRAVVSSRTPQGAVAWVVFLLAAPWFALPAYLVFGRHKLRFYEHARRTSRLLSQGSEATSRGRAPSDREVAVRRPFETLAQMPVVDGNSARLLIDGEETFAAVFAAIDAAEKYVCFQFYTIADDDLGRAMSDHLVAAAQRGVAVRVIYDGVGSHLLAASYRRRLSDAGVTILDPRIVRGPTQRFEVNFRNHRKTVVVDGEIGFVGGHNVTELYMGKGAPGGHWRDTHLMLRGPVVAQLQTVFFEDWHWASDESLSDALDWMPTPQPQNLAALILPSGPGDDVDTGALFFFSAIGGARRRIWIASPYFVPDDAILSALKAAAMRGCDVRLLVPAAPDHYLTWLAAFAYFDEVADLGISVLRYGPGFLHQKVVLMDDHMAAVGTANLDNRSFRLNFETMALVFDAGFAAEVERMLEKDFENCTREGVSLREQKWMVRLAAPFARLLAPIL